MRGPSFPGKTSVDKDLKKIVRLEKSTRKAGRRILKVGLGLLFLVVVWMFATLHAGAAESGIFVIAAGIIGGYMALNIGANDVANNMGPAVGARALTMTGALVIAATCEAAGAILAGGDVVATISKGIIDPTPMADATTFIKAMMAALLGAALWLNLATYIGTPVSTTHAIVGGVVGAGIAATGIEAVNWATMSAIAASWIVSPVMGGVLAAIFLAFVKFAILYRDDKIAAAKRWVPVLVSIMAAAFSMYLVMKGLKKVWRADGLTVIAIGVLVFAATQILVKPLVARRAATLENRRKAVNVLFTIPLICSTAFLSFAHGANDVANAVGPLAAIVGAAGSGGIAAAVEVPLWVMVVGAAGISAGLVLFGPRLIRTVGEKITKLNPVRAYCVALSAAVTVIIASALGLPVSSTHIALGGIFGVGFFRELVTNWNKTSLSPRTLGAAAPDTAGGGQPDNLARKLRKAQKRRLVRRQHLLTIAAAWVVTVPMAAVLAGILFALMTGFPVP